MAGSTGPTGAPAADADCVNLRFIILIVAVATLGGFMFGSNSGVINGTQDGLEAAFDLSALGTGMNVGAILLGCFAQSIANFGISVSFPSMAASLGLTITYGFYAAGAAAVSFFLVSALVREPRGRELEEMTG